MTTNEELQKLDKYLSTCKPHERKILEAKRARLLEESQKNPFGQKPLEKDFDLARWMRENKEK